MPKLNSGTIIGAGAMIVGVALVFWGYKQVF